MSTAMRAGRTSTRARARRLAPSELALATLAGVLALAPLAGCSAVVGATCADGLVLCAGRCVDVSRDPAHCGACTLACAPPGACVAGRCTGGLDGGSPDGGDAALDAGDALAPDGDRLDAGPFDADRLDAGPLDAPALDGDLFDAPGLDALLPDAAGLDAAGSDAGPLDAAGLDAPGLDAPGADAGPPCIAPEVYCAPLCVDLLTDSEHCGRCGNVCPSGLCSAGTCVAAFAGHVVLVGHDYETSRIAMRRIVGNAVFLARTSPVSVVAYVGDATAASRAGTDNAIDATALALGRTWTRTVASSAAVPGLLPTTDVLLVYAQRNASDAELAALGTAWGPALAPFLVRGGVVVVLDTVSGANLGTWQILAAAGLLTATGVTEATGDTLRVAVPGDAVALGVPLTYRGERTTVSFATTNSVVVVTDSAGAPVVVHLTSVP